MLTSFKPANAVSDASSLVRSYAAATIGALGTQKDLEKLQRLRKTERSPTARVGLLEAIYELGDKSVLYDLIALTEHHNYRIRCAAVNTLGNIDLAPSDRVCVLHSLLLRMKKEPTVAVMSSLKNGIRALRAK